MLLKRQIVAAARSSSEKGLPCLATSLSHTYKSGGTTNNTHSPRFSTSTEIPTIPGFAVEGKRPMVTTPIFYVNGEPHLGHLHSATLADATARWAALFPGVSSPLLVSGTDEHGPKVATAASKRGLTPIELCDATSPQFQALFEAADVIPGEWLRTTQKRHEEAVKAMWSRLIDSGAITLGEYSGWYCMSDEAFLNEDETVVGEDGERVSLESGQPVSWISEPNYVFDLAGQLSAVKEWLSEPGRVEPESRRKEVLAQVERGVPGPLSVSRLAARAPWGIPVPGDPDHVVYVWVDALTNYLTATGWPETSVETAEASGSSWPADIHVVGKDILKFHAMYWPAFLSAAGLPLPRKIVAHAHWTAGKRKMSKSLGNVVDPWALLEDYGSDAVRWVLMTTGGLANDADWDTQRLMAKATTDLTNTMGNLISRATAPTLLPSRLVPGVECRDSRFDDVARLLESLPLTMDAAVAKGDWFKASGALASAAGELNAVFAACEPWTLKDRPEELEAVIGSTLDGMRRIAILAQPVIPKGSSAMLNAMSVPESHRTLAHYHTMMEQEGEHRMLPAGKLAPIFPNFVKAKKGKK